MLKRLFRNDYFKAAKAFQPIIQKIEQEINERKKRDALIDDACMKISIQSGVPLEMVKTDTATYKRILNTIEAKSSQPLQPSPMSKS